MTTTTQANGTAAESKASSGRGFAGLPCMYCGESDCLTVDLCDLTGTEAIHCTQCETDYSVEDVQNKISAWLPVLKWIEQAPAL